MVNRAAPLIYARVRDVAGNTERIIEQTHRIRSLEYIDSTKQADKCTLKVDNFHLENFDDPVWAHGNFLQVSWGYPGLMALTREVVIQKVTGFVELSIVGRAKSVLMDAQKRSRTFKNKTRAEIVLQIAREYGYADDTLHIEDTGSRFAHVTQANISDAQLLKKLAHQQGFEFYVDQDGFHWHEERYAQAPIRSYVWYSGAQERLDLRWIDVDVDVTRRPAKVERKTRDPLTKKTKTVEASNETDKEREGTAYVQLTRAPDLRSGALQSGYTPADAGPLMCSGGGDPEAAKAEVKAKFRAAQRGSVKLTLTCVGDPQMLAKTVIHLGGVGNRLTGYYVVREVKHEVSSEYKMEVKVVSDGLGEMTDRKQSRVEAGIPQVAGTPSKAKKPADVTSANTASIILGRSVDNGALEAVDIKDAAGNVIGTGWKERSGAAQPRAVVIDPKTKKAVQVGG